MSSLRMRAFFLALVVLAGLAGARNAFSATQLLRATPPDKAGYVRLLEAAPEARDEGAVVRGTAVEFPAAEGRAAELSSLGFPVEIAIPDLEAFYADRLGHTRDYGGYHNYVTGIQDFDLLLAAHPNIMSRNSIGTTIEGRSMWVYKISNSPNADNGKPEILFNAYIHAREPITFEINYDLANTLVSGYGSDPRITNIVDNRQVYIIPFMNPDGVEYNHTTDPNGGGMWRKNRRHNSDGSWGVDLNRNWGYNWGYDNIGSSPYGSDDTYRGTSAFSEPEIAAVRGFVNAHHFTLAMNDHAYGGYEIYGWSYDSVHCPDNDVLYSLARMRRATSGYSPGTAWELLYMTNGDSNDWLYGEQVTKPKIFSLTTESGNGTDGFWPAPSRIPTLLSQNHEPNLHFCELADNPGRIMPPGWSQVSAPDTVAPNFTLTWTIPQPDPDNPATSWNLLEGSGATVGADNLEGTNQARWSADGWTWSTARSHSASHSFYSGNLDVQNNSLVSRRGHKVLAGEQLKFWTWYQLESAWDYGYVEVSTNGRNFTPLAGSITTNSDPNNRNLGNGITGNSPGWVQATFNLSIYTGQVIWVRFRYNSDSYTTYEGWYVDDVEPSELFATETLVASNLTSAQYTFTNHFPGTFSYLVQSVDADGDVAVWSPPKQVTVSNSTSVSGPLPSPWNGLEVAGQTPFHGTASLRFTVPSSGMEGEPVRLTIHDVHGRQVASLLDTAIGGGARPGTVLSRSWDPKGEASGLYFARLTVGTRVSEARLVYMK